MYLHWTTGRDGLPAVQYRIYTDVAEWAAAELTGFATTYRDRFKRKWQKVGCGFDIETTKYGDRSFMYHWQLSYGKSIILGRTWDTCVEAFERIQGMLAKTSSQLICWIANLGFEFSFLQHRLPITKVFAKTEHHPLKCTVGRIELRDCLALSGIGGLKTLAKNYCKTAKAENDLDYKKIRNSQTALDETEIGYCIADVAILSEWSDYVHKRWCSRNGECKIPLTTTGIVRDAIRDACGDKLRDVSSSVVARYPRDVESYQFWMRWVFRGGFTHANIYHVLDDIPATDPGVIGADFTSSYPAVMLHSAEYPMTQFLPVDIATDGRRITDSIIYEMAVIMTVELTNVRTTTMHSIESVHKIQLIDGQVVDNGRLQRCDRMTVSLTNIDYQIYCMFYEWDSIKILHAEAAYKGRLPDYVLRPLMSAYETKQHLKQQGMDGTPEYQNAKGIVNSYYGCMVQRLVFDDVVWDPVTGWDTVETAKTYKKLISGSVLLPQWGIWVTALARQALLSVVHRLDPDKRHNSVIYCDTDSIYMLDTAENRTLIDLYNGSMYRQNRKLPAEFADLGAFDWIDHGAHYRFKTLGAKRYLKYDPETQHIRVTVAGLRLGTLERTIMTDEADPDDSSTITVKVDDGQQYLSINDLFRLFDRHISVDSKISLKNYVRYHEKPYDDIVAGEHMQELSGCTLHEIGFEMTMAQYYVWMIRDVHDGRYFDN